jgi:hypothetical protein
MQLARTHLRLLTFQATREELLAMGPRHLAAGLLWTWLAGIGRWWDDPGAHWLQHLGVGSVVYVFVLSVLLWLVALPLGAENWTYRRVLTLVSLTSPPALLYAIPVERWWSVEAAATANVWFLVVVAVWRVALLVSFYGRVAELRAGTRALATLLPIMGVIVVLTALKLDGAVFDLMAGLRHGAPRADDLAHELLSTLSILSVLGAWVVVPLYINAVAVRSWRDREEKRARTRLPQTEAVDDEPGTG